MLRNAINMFIYNMVFNMLEKKFLKGGGRDIFILKTIFAILFAFERKAVEATIWIYAKTLTAINHNSQKSLS